MDIHLAAMTKICRRFFFFSEITALITVLSITIHTEFIIQKKNKSGKCTYLPNKAIDNTIYIGLGCMPMEFMLGRIIPP